MNKKLQAAINLLNAGNEAKLYQGLCLLLEVAEESPKDLDPVTKALVNPVLRRIVKTIEKNLGIKESFDGDISA